MQSGKVSPHASELGRGLEPAFACAFAPDDDVFSGRMNRVSGNLCFG